MREPTYRKPVSGFEVLRSREFRALCERFGIRISPRQVSIQLTLTRELLTVQETYQPSPESHWQYPEDYMGDEERKAKKLPPYSEAEEENAYFAQRRTPYDVERE